MKTTAPNTDVCEHCKKAKATKTHLEITSVPESNYSQPPSPILFSFCDECWDAHYLRRLAQQKHNAATHTFTPLEYAIFAVVIVFVILFLLIGIHTVESFTQLLTI